MVADIKDGQSGQYFKDIKEVATLHNVISDALGDKYQLSTPAVATGLGWLEVSHDEHRVVMLMLTSPPGVGRGVQDSDWKLVSI